MTNKMKLAVGFALAVGIAGWVSGSVVSAKEQKSVQKPESAMMSACEKEYPTAVKGKKFNEVAEWVESEESGANAAIFKKSKCYAAHEKWEGMSGKEEAGEKHSSK